MANDAYFCFPCLGEILIEDALYDFQNIIQPLAFGEVHVHHDPTRIIVISGICGSKISYRYISKELIWIANNRA